MTTGVDICPSLQAANLARLEAALADMGAVRRDGRGLVVDEAHLRAEPVIELSTDFGELKLIAAPTGVPRGYDALRAGANSEHLGGGLRPEIASTGDLVAMPAALRRDEDLRRIPELRRILELEADPAALVAPSPPPACPPAPPWAARSATSSVRAAAAPARAAAPAAEPRSHGFSSSLVVETARADTPRAPRCSGRHGAVSIGHTRLSYRPYEAKLSAIRWLWTRSALWHGF